MLIVNHANYTMVSFNNFRLLLRQSEAAFLSEDLVKLAILF